MRRRRFAQLLGTSAVGTALASRSGWGQRPGPVALASVPGLAFRTGRQCTLLGCLEAVLRYHGEAYDYVDLMGLSGAAFRIRIAYPTTDLIMGGRIHPGVSVDASFGPHVAAIAEATGYELRLDGHFLHGNRGEEIVARLIEAEIDQGRPVVAMNLMGGSCWGVIVGYGGAVPLRDAAEETQSKRYLCRTYYDPPNADYQPASRFPWDIYAVKRAGEALPAEVAFAASIERAVQLLEAESGTVERPTGWMYFFRPEYANGLHAYDAWMDDLRDEEGIRQLTPAQLLMYWQGHAVMYDQLHDARRAATAYLSKIAPRFGDRQAALLGEAVGIYQGLVEQMTANWECFPFSDEGYVEPETGWWLRVETEEFLDTQIPAYAAEWTREMRQAGCQLLAALRQREEQALAALREVA